MIYLTLGAAEPKIEGVPELSRFQVLAADTHAAQVRDTSLALVGAIVFRVRNRRQDSRARVEKI